MMYSYKLSIFLREFLFGFLRGNLETLFSKLCVWYIWRSNVYCFLYLYIPHFEAYIFFYDCKKDY